MIPKSLYKKRIYYAKWTAVTNAFRKGKDLLVMDLDAVLLRDPSSILEMDDNYDSPYDIISSRDHGPADLLFAGIIRFDFD